MCMSPEWIHTTAVFYRNKSAEQESENKRDGERKREIYAHYRNKTVLFRVEQKEWISLKFILKI